MKDADLEFADSEPESEAKRSGENAAAPRQAAVSTGPALYLVGTPIGNLEDVTLRALRVLKEVDMIACEDTRQTQKLLNHYAIATRTTSYHEHNEMTKSAELVKEMQEGASVALVTDAGMPGISDPGYRLIALAIRHRVPVVPIPGASAFLSALVASGLPTDSFRFSGFLPGKRGERQATLEAVKSSPRTQVFYEAPHRLVEALADVVEVLGEARPVVVAREVTKLHEEFLRGRAGEVLENLRAREAVKGEITLLIGKASEEKVGTDACIRLSVRQRVEQIMAEEKVDEKSALKKVARERGVSKSEAYRELQRSRVKSEVTLLRRPE
ncbi:MAG TPA: 16S rRNA (cytidine(1402)-2'-O)-methyltransferase [Candidatus Sulfotelmatobacter sp.]